MPNIKPLTTEVKSAKSESAAFQSVPWALCPEPVEGSC